MQSDVKGENKYVKQYVSTNSQHFLCGNDTAQTSMIMTANMPVNTSVKTTLTGR